MELFRINVSRRQNRAAAAAAVAAAAAAEGEGEGEGPRTGSSDRMEERSALFGLFVRREILWNNTRRGRENAREKLTRSICRGRARARPADGGGGGEILLRFVT